MADPSTTRRPARAPFVRFVFWAFAVAGCTFGVDGCTFGADGTNPFADAFVADAAAVSVGQGGTGGTIDATDPGTGGTFPNSDGSGGVIDSTGDASSGVSTGGVASVPSSDGSVGTAGSSEGCQPPTPAAVCDPVKNIGCLIPLSFCDIDPTQSTPSGRCVFPTSPAPGDAGACAVAVLSESCAPLSTCVNGACRRLCYCDSDCPVGSCCTDPAPGPRAFRLCAPC
ncbi:MAG TPA: hypothetical protein VH142_23710 [Polyangiaceae bacterium]|nr:hypothetical protein [Polyangiaceae bacterium]